MDTDLYGPRSTAESRAAASKLKPSGSSKQGQTKSTSTIIVPPTKQAGVFWVGEDGNIWVKNNDGSVQNKGKALMVGPNAFDSDKVSSDAYKQIDIPNPSRATTANAEVSGGGTVYPDLSSAIAILRENIKALDPIEQAEINKAIKKWEIANNERISSFNEAEAASEASGVTNDQTVLGARNTIGKNVRVSAEDIMSMLGSLGMSGSTTQKALNIIADTGNTNLNEANFTYGKNKQNILQKWNDYVEDDKAYQKQLDDQKAAGIAQAGINKATATKDYLSQIASNNISMGKFDNSDVLGEIANANNTIASLSNPAVTYTGVKPAYTAPTMETILGNNVTKFGVAPTTPTSKVAPKIIKVNEQTGNGSEYGIK